MNLDITPRGQAYIRYAFGPVVGPQQEIGLEVIVDRNAAGEIVGIEIVDVNVQQSVSEARAFATSQGLDFPRDLVGALHHVRATKEARLKAERL